MAVFDNRKPSHRAFENTELSLSFANWAVKSKDSEKISATDLRIRFIPPSFSGLVNSIYMYLK